MRLWARTIKFKCFRLRFAELINEHKTNNHEPSFSHNFFVFFFLNRSKRQKPTHIIRIYTSMSYRGACTLPEHFRMFLARFMEFSCNGFGCGFLEGGSFFLAIMWSLWIFRYIHIRVCRKSFSSFPKKKMKWLKIFRTKVGFGKPF